MKALHFIPVALVVTILAVFAPVALAQSGPPNPFDWNDAQAKSAGKNLYTQKCSGCHGPAGSGLPDFDFSSASFSQELEAQPDLYFQVVSEGRLDKGMPPYKSSLSEEQIWQILTYVHSLSSPAPIPGTSEPDTGSEQESKLVLMASEDASSGQNLAFTAILKDSQNNPISGAAIQFFLTEDFFASGRMEIGEAITDEEGTATLNYIAKRSGEQTLIAKYNDLETQSRLSVVDSGQYFYTTEAGINFQSVGPEIFAGPPSSHDLGEMGFAPAPALRLPGGIFSWLWLYIGVVVVIWGIYFIVMYQTLRIADNREKPTHKTKLFSLAKRTNVTLIPTLGLVVVSALGLIIVLMIITGPYSHFHLMP